MSVKETDDQRERGNERGMEDKDRTGRKERGRQRKTVLKCVGEGKKRETERREKKTKRERWKRERKEKEGGKMRGFERNRGNEDTFLGKERPFLVPIAT